MKTGIITVTMDYWEPEDGKILKEKREALHYSIRDVQALTGIGSGTVNRYENGPIKYVDIYKYNRLLYFYNCMLDTLEKWRDQND